ncbi:MAG: shikimate dehydrogenase [FCB group bacterium]|nr:shikimate dehydrogenase [FCB group bacterium]
MSEGPFHFGLVGQGISYSLSPEIFSQIAKLEGIAIEFTIFDQPISRLPELKEDLKKLDGISVTIPHKRAIMPYLDFSSYEARQIGAVNSIKTRDGSLFGLNTDTAGFIYPIRRLTQELKKIMVMGHGGAARAVIWALLREYPQTEIKIIGRDREKSTRFASEVNEYSEAAQLQGGCYDDIIDNDKFDLIINCTPLGGFEYRDISPMPESFRFAGKPLCYDLVYRPRETVFLNRAKKSECRTINGISMLVIQALTSYNVWTEREIDIDGLGQNICKQLSISED